MQLRKPLYPLYLTQPIQKRKATCPPGNRTNKSSQKRAQQQIIKSGIYFGNFAKVLGNNPDLTLEYTPTSNRMFNKPHIPTETSPRVYINKARFNGTHYQQLFSEREKDNRVSIHAYSSQKTSPGIPPQENRQRLQSTVKLNMVINRPHKTEQTQSIRKRPHTAFIGESPLEFADFSKKSHNVEDSSPTITRINSWRHDSKVSIDRCYEQADEVLTQQTKQKLSQHFTILAMQSEKKVPIEQVEVSVNDSGQQTIIRIPQRPQTGRTFVKRISTQHNIERQEVVTLDRFEIGDVIGTGSYAVVKKAKDRMTGKVVAIKSYPRKQLSDMNRKTNLKREIRMLQKLKHPNIVSLLFIVQTKTTVDLVMEFVSSVSLRQYLKQRDQLEEEEARAIFKQIMGAIHHCHSKDIVHRDIKLENVMIDNGVVKLIDFGFSVQSDLRLNVYCGTPSYMAPEIVSRQEYFGKPADIWAAGVLLYVLLHGNFPFRGKEDNELFSVISKGQFRTQSSLSYEAQTLLGRMLTVNYLDRITTNEVLLSLNPQILDLEWLRI